MAAMNVVHMRVKPGREEEFLAINRDFRDLKMTGLRNFWIVKTGERDFIVVGEWNEMSDLVRARPEMIASLDRQRSLLEDLGGGRGVTEPWSGEVTLSLKPSVPSDNAL